jgi:hypothetical protein
MQNAPDHSDQLARLADTYGVPPGVLEDLVARRRAGALDGELVNLLAQPDRGGLDKTHARTLVDRLPKR